MNQQRIIDDFYVYTANFGTVEAAATKEQSVNIESDSQFQLQKLTYFCTDSAGTQQSFNSRILPNMTLGIVDSGSGRSMFKEPVPISSICGTGEFPHILATPKLFKANSIITLSINNFNPQNYTNVYIQLIGKKVFKVQ